MKLYLSSYRFGDNPQLLAELVEINKKVAIIPNALDVYPNGERKDASLQKERNGLTQIGLQPEILDLRNYFGKPEELNLKMSEYGAVWVLGGNTFILRKAFKESGLDQWLIKQKDNHELVYAGYSAGVCVLSPTLKGLEMVDDPNSPATGYNSEIVWDGLSIIDFAFAPHFESPGHPETDAVSKEVEHYQKTGVKYKALHDGEVIIIK